MKSHFLPAVVVIVLMVTCSCEKGSAKSPPGADAKPDGASSASPALVKVNKYGYAVFCDIASGADGTLHRRLHRFT